MDRNVKITPEKGSGSKGESKQNISMVAAANETKTNSKAFGIN